MNNRKKDCSKYKEETKRKLSIEKRKKSNKNGEYCQERKSLCDKCSKKKNRKITKSCVFQNKLKCNDLLTKIKPPLSVREKYSNPQHVVCFAEKAQNSRKQNEIIYTTAEGETRNSKRKNVNLWCKTISEDNLSELLELKCESVCSFDSTIDLKGLSITARDLKKIEKNRRSVHPSKGNEEEIIEDMKKDNSEENIEETPLENVPA